MELSEFPKRARAAARQAQDTGPLMQRIAFIAIGPIKRRVRVLTGALRNSVHDRVSPSQAAIVSNLYYAKFVDDRYPFMEPGLAEAMPRIEQELKDFGLKITSKVTD